MILGKRDTFAFEYVPAKPGSAPFGDLLVWVSGHRVGGRNGPTFLFPTLRFFEAVLSRPAAFARNFPNASPEEVLAQLVAQPGGNAPSLELFDGYAFFVFVEADGTVCFVWSDGGVPHRSNVGWPSFAEGVRALRCAYESEVDEEEEGLKKN